MNRNRYASTYIPGLWNRIKDLRQGERDRQRRGGEKEGKLNGKVKARALHSRQESDVRTRVLHALMATAIDAETNVRTTEEIGFYFAVVEIGKGKTATRLGN